MTVHVNGKNAGVIAGGNVKIGAMNVNTNTISDNRKISHKNFDYSNHFGNIGAGDGGGGGNGPGDGGRGGNVNIAIGDVTRRPESDNFSGGSTSIGKTQGGTGGPGGNATSEAGVAGRGGDGGEARINNYGNGTKLSIDELNGGTGGGGGEAPTHPGDGGSGGKAVIQNGKETLFSGSRSPGRNMPIAEFAELYSLSDDFVELLMAKGYGTAGSLRFATVADLKEDGFGKGHINQLKHALDLWASN